MARGGAKLSEEAKAVRLALMIVPAAQVANGKFRRVDVANRTEADQRHMVRSRETRTIRRTSPIDRLANLQIISPRQAVICEWYQRQHELGYEVSCGCTANYMGAGGNGLGSSDLFARHAAQANARQNYQLARETIPHLLVPMFERFVIHGMNPINRTRGAIRFNLANSFRMVIDMLDNGIGHLVSDDA